MSDFTYDNEDFSAVRVATKGLQQAECRALTISSLLWAGYATAGYLGRNKPQSAWSKSPLSVIAIGGGIGALFYLTYTWHSRSRLDRVAELVNTKYSNIISRTMHYED